MKKTADLNKGFQVSGLDTVKYIALEDAVRAFALMKVRMLAQSEFIGEDLWDLGIHLISVIQSESVTDEAFKTACNLLGEVERFMFDMIWMAIPSMFIKQQCFGVPIGTPADEFDGLIDEMKASHPLSSKEKSRVKTLSQCFFKITQKHVAELAASFVS